MKKYRKEWGLIRRDTNSWNLVRKNIHKGISVKATIYSEGIAYRILSLLNKKESK
jgi:hypothetical protein